ncbi:Trypsin-1 [Eumeta japonica]|uniref:Trypsin-1 n=1 Tax=Eumeta variegata TaxID=151549 RepID=A0A4C1ZV54_EUMVA|nr:Trypsin-1 [Eumeta japonica]
MFDDRYPQSAYPGRQTEQATEDFFSLEISSVNIRLQKGKGPRAKVPGPVVGGTTYSIGVCLEGSARASAPRPKNSCYPDTNQDSAPKENYVGVVGGEPVPIEEFPYQVAIKVENQYHCTGTIIHEQRLSSYTVVVGTADIEEGGKVYYIERFINHHKNDYMGDYDLGIIKLKDRLETSDKVAIAKLSTVKKGFKKGTVFNITGWGATKVNKKTNTLLLVYFFVTFLGIEQECESTERPTLCSWTLPIQSHQRYADVLSRNRIFHGEGSGLMEAGV